MGDQVRVSLPTGSPVVDNTNIQTAGPRGPALLFAATILLSAFLLFLVQPITAKQILREQSHRVPILDSS